MQAARGASLKPSDPVDPHTTSRRLDARLVFAAIAVLAYAVDQLSKQWAMRELADGDVPLLGDWFTLHLTFNPGAAFSTGTSHTAIISVIAIVAAVVVMWFLGKVRSLGWAVALGLLLAGILGNLADRLFRAPGPFRGHVVDFLELPNWPIFNVADICINTAAALIVIQSLRGVPLRGRDGAEPVAEVQR